MPDCTEEAERFKEADVEYSKWWLSGPPSPGQTMHYHTGAEDFIYKSNKKTLNFLKKLVRCFSNCIW